MIPKVKRDLRQSDLKKFRQTVEQRKYFAPRSRSLTADEIAQLEAQGNRSSDWKLITVAHDFDCSRVTRCEFVGEVNLPHFFGTVRTPEGVSVPTGIDHCTICDSIIGNSHLHSIGLISKMVIQQGAVLRNIGSLSTTGLTTFGIGRQLSIGMEVGGRTLITYPEVTLEEVTEILFNKQDLALQNSYQQEIETYREEIRSEFGFVGAESSIINSVSLRNVWIGPGALIDGVNKLSNSCILSSLDRSTIVRDGAIVEHSLLQRGTCVESMAWVCDSLLLEASSASRHARLRYTIIASNSHIKGGEISNSLIGPFVGLHHQAHIASLLWPKGAGSIGAGALISGDAMGRTPNREALIGEGITFGQGVTLLFPINLSQSPWSFVSAGSVLTSQQLSFPFSLIRNRAPSLEAPQQCEILPGWALAKNTPALARAVHKFAERDRIRGGDNKPHFLSKESAEMVLQALQRLLQVEEICDFYTDKEISGLGDCVLRESNRQRAISTYKLFLERYALTQAVTEIEEKPELLQKGPVAKLLFNRSPSREICRLVSIPAQLPMIIRRYRILQKEWRDLILKTVAEERAQGNRVFNDWLETHHDPMHGMSFVVDEVKESDRKVRLFLQQIRQMRG